MEKMDCVLDRALEAWNLRIKQRQSIALMPPERLILQQTLRLFEKIPNLRRTHAFGQKSLFGLAQKVLEADRILLRLPSGSVCRHVKGNTEAGMAVDKYLPKLFKGDSIHTKTSML
jgi:hypothetical protein